MREAVRAGRLTREAGRNIRHWLVGRGYEPFRNELLGLIRASDFAELQRCFWEVVPFGTGGRRGPMAALGSATINARTVGESACGLARYLQSLGTGADERIAIACDTRHRSEEFAKLTARVLAAQGFAPQIFRGHRATPALSFAVRHLGCVAGVMISASHNPPADNGVKVYWSNGGQVLPPHDVGILSAVARVEEIPLVDFDEALVKGRIAWIAPEVDEAYITAVCRESLSAERGLSVLYTPLHGVGETSVAKVLARAGFNGVEIYEPHREPNGAFPNVPQHLANPELPSVFEGPIGRAKETGADLILASDPDADRLGAAVRDERGEYVYLSGNRLGAILADFVLRSRSRRGLLTTSSYVVTTLVTSPLIRHISEAYGVRVIDDLLVGFKYIAQTIDREGPAGHVFACEESLGYLAGDYIRDKDAAVGALLLCECAAELRREGKTLLDHLDEIHRAHGYVAERQRSVTRHGAEGQAEIRELMQRLREAPPKELAGLALTEAADYGRHEVRTLPANTRDRDLPEPRSDLVFLHARTSEFMLSLGLRPSGTEPKAKSYLFVRGPFERRQDVEVLAEQAMRDFWTWGERGA